MTRLRARFDGKVLVPIGPVELPQGPILEVDVRQEQTEVGSADAILLAVREPPHVSGDTVDELERAIESGKLDVRFKGSFDSDQ